MNLPLVGIVLAGAAFVAYYTLKVTEWSVMTDELLYVKLGLGVGDSLSPLPKVHGHDFAVFSQLYPLLTAPVYQLFDMPTAFRVVHGMNALLMASAAIPAYLLAREIVPDRKSAYLVAAITVAVPWMTMSTTILTEVVAYPVFVWAMLAMQRAIARPSVARDVLALAAIALAFLGRTQFIALAGILVIAIVVHEIAFAATGPVKAPFRHAIRDGFRTFIDQHRVLAVATVVGVLIAIPALLQGSLSEVLGNYEAATERSLLPPGILRAATIHLDFVVVAIGIVPFVLALAWVMASLVRPFEKAGHAYAVLLLLAVVLFTFQVSSFDLNFGGGGVQDRYLFYIVPPLVVGMVACLREPRMAWPAILVAGALFTAIVGVADYTGTGGPFFGSPASAFHTVLDGRSYSLGRHLGINDLSPATVLTIGTVALTIALAAAVRFAPRQAVFWAVGLSVLGFCFVETRYSFGRIVLGSGNTVRALDGRPLEGRDWIDSALPGRPSVGLVPAPITVFDPSKRHAVPTFMPEFESEWWYTEAWNKSVDATYSFEESPTYTPFPRNHLKLDFDTGRLSSDGRSSYLVVAPGDPRFRPAGHVVAEKIVQLLKVDFPYRAVWATRRVGPDGWTRPGGPSVIRVYGDTDRAAGRRLRVTLFSTADLKGKRRYSIAARGARRTGTLRPGEVRTESLTVCVPRAGHEDLRISVPQTSRLQDGRRVGLLVARISSEPSKAVCGTGRTA